MSYVVARRCHKVSLTLNKSRKGATEKTGSFAEIPVLTLCNQRCKRVFRKIRAGICSWNVIAAQNARFFGAEWFACVGHAVFRNEPKMASVLPTI